MVALNAPIPEFLCHGLDGLPHRPPELRGRPAVFCFWSAACPWSVYADGVLNGWDAGLKRMAAVVRIASNAEETADEIRRAAAERRAEPVWLDPQREAADVLEAAATPHFFLIDRDGILRYRGALDDATFRERTPQHHWLADAVRAVAGGKNPVPAETCVYGCAIPRF